MVCRECTSTCEGCGKPSVPNNSSFDDMHVNCTLAESSASLDSDDTSKQAD